METPVGNPNVSLLPQPAVATPIEPMRGGGIMGGGGAENVSLLPQPAVPTPIEPMRGGGPENVSLLPQPSVAAPIEPMRGGARVPLLRLVRYEQPLVKQLEEPEYIEDERVVLTSKSVTDYTNYRKGHPWEESQMPKDPNSVSSIMPHFLDFDSNHIIYVYFVYDFKHFLQIQFKINRILKLKSRKHNEIVPIFIIIDNTRSSEEFDDIYRKFIEFVNILNKKKLADDEIDYKDYEIYFLFNKNDANNRIIWQLSEQKPKGARAKFFFLEPDSICIKYKYDNKDRGLCFIPTSKKDRDLEEYTGISTDGIKIEFEEKGLRIKKINELDEKTDKKEVYMIDTKGNKKFWLTEHLILNLSADLPSSATTDSVADLRGLTEEEEDTTAASASTSTPAAAVVTPPPPPPPKQIFTIKGLQTIPINLGGKFFEIRKPTVAVNKEWDEAKFTPQEKELFETIGVTEDFEKQKGYEEERELLVLGRPDFLRSITLTECLNDSKYLLAYECSFMRDYLQTLLKIRQFDRIRAATSFLAKIDDFDVKIQADKSVKGLRIKSKVMTPDNLFFETLLKNIFDGANILNYTLVDRNKYFLDELLKLKSKADVNAAAKAQSQAKDSAFFENLMGLVLDYSKSIQRKEKQDPSSVNYKPLLKPKAPIVIPPPPPVKKRITVVDFDDFSKEVDQFLAPHERNDRALKRRLFDYISDRKKYPTLPAKNSKYVTIVNSFRLATKKPVGSASELRLVEVGLTTEKAEKIFNYIKSGRIKKISDLPAADVNLYDIISKYKYEAPIV